MEIAHRVIADAVFAVGGRLANIDAVGTVEFVQRVGIADQKIDRAAFRIRRPYLQKHLRVAQAHAGEGRRLAPGEGDPEAELLGVELDGRVDVIDGQSRVDPLAFDVGRVHGGYYECSPWLSSWRSS